MQNLYNQFTNPTPQIYKSGEKRKTQSIRNIRKYK